MNILVLGGTNFIGPYVVRQLVEQGHQVTVFHRGKTTADLPRTVQHILGDLTHLEDYKAAFQQLAPEVLLVMVAYTQADAKRVIDTLKEIAQRVVVISSQDVYRARDVLWKREAGVDAVPLTEASPLRTQLYPFRDLPEALGDISPDYEKILVERLFQNSPDFPATILRLPMVYGPNDYRHRLYPYLRRMDEGRPAIVLEVGMAQWRGSYGYVENVASAISLAITDPRAASRTYNISEYSPLSEADFIRAIGRQAEWTGKVVVVPTAQMPTSWQNLFNPEQDWVTDSTLFRQELGYTETIEQDEALRRTIRWERTIPPNSDFQDDPHLLDYDNEDALLATLAQHSP